MLVGALPTAMAITPKSIVTPVTPPSGLSAITAGTGSSDSRSRDNARSRDRETR